MIVGLCERFGQLPSAVLAEDAQLLAYVRIAGIGVREGVENRG